MAMVGHMFEIGSIPFGAIVVWLFAFGSSPVGHPSSRTPSQIPGEAGKDRELLKYCDSAK